MIFPDGMFTILVTVVLSLLIAALIHLVHRRSHGRR